MQAAVFGCNEGKDWRRFSFKFPFFLCLSHSVGTNARKP